MTGWKDWLGGLRALKLPRDAPLIVHASLSAFGYVTGGAQMVVSALLQEFNTVIMPTFTYATMVTPEVGPADNGLSYGTAQYSNARAVFFDPHMPADHLMGAVPEALRLQPGAGRSNHPILSFTGVNANKILASQTLADPLAPIGALREADGWVLLLGVDQTVNTSIHFAEQLAGRESFIRWALTREGIVECPRFPGCSDGFSLLALRLADATRWKDIGNGVIQAAPLAEVIRAAQACLAEDPLALLCDRSYCERCESTRKRLAISD